MPTKTKTIKMLLYDGDMSGVMNISDSAWDSGKMYSAPRASINDLIARADCKKYGVYLLLSDNQVYIGQASDLERRTRQHLSDKDWWTQVILMTTKDDSFNASDIDWLEAILIDLAGKAGVLDSDNKRKGNPQKVDEFRQAELEQYLGEALFLLELIGVRVFSKRGKRAKAKGSTTMISTDQSAFAEKVARYGKIISKPPLPDKTLRPCAYVNTSIKALLEGGYKFSDEQMKAFTSVEGSKKITKRNLPLFWLLKDGETRASCPKDIRERYWAEEFVCDSYRFLVFSQWYDNANKGATPEIFDEWYASL